MEISRKESPWVLFEIKEIVYAISCQVVLSLNQLPKTTPIPRSPIETRGVIAFRNRSIQLVDVRKIFNLTSIPEEIILFAEMMKQRYQDHLNWINTLEKSIIEGTSFTLTTDPHKCAFGKWYDSYNPKNTNIMFLSTFAKFDKPHKTIHQVAIKAQELIKAGKKEEAIKEIEKVKKNELQEMLRLFKDIDQAYEDSLKEIVVVAGSDEQHCIGLSVDKIVAIEHLSDYDESLIKETATNTEFIYGLGKRKDGSVVFLLNDEYILKNFH